MTWPSLVMDKSLLKKTIPEPLRSRSLKEQEAAITNRALVHATCRGNRCPGLEGDLTVLRVEHERGGSIGKLESATIGGRGPSAQGKHGTCTDGCSTSQVKIKTETSIVPA